MPKNEITGKKENHSVEFTDFFSVTQILREVDFAYIRKDGTFSFYELQLFASENPQNRLNFSHVCGDGVFEMFALW